MLAKQLPEPVLAVFRQGRTAEFTTLNKSGAPVTWPTLPFFDEATDRFIVTTSIAFPDKAYNVRPARLGWRCTIRTQPAAGWRRHPIVLIQGDAVAPTRSVPRSPALNRNSARFSPPALEQDLQRQMCTLTRYLFDWYYMRLTITITAAAHSLVARRRTSHSCHCLSR